MLEPPSRYRYALDNNINAPFDPQIMHSHSNRENCGCVTSSANAEFSRQSCQQSHFETGPQLLNNNQATV